MVIIASICEFKNVLKQNTNILLFVQNVGNELDEDELENDLVYWKIHSNNKIQTY